MQFRGHWGSRAWPEKAVQTLPGRACPGFSGAGWAVGERWPGVAVAVAGIP